MISAWELYLWTRLDAFEVVSIMSIMFIVVWLILMGISAALGSGYGEGDRDAKRARAMGKSIYFKVALVIFILAMFIPSKKDAAMIWIVPQLATIENAELLKGEAAEIYKLAKEALKESIDVEPEEK